MKKGPLQDGKLNDSNDNGVRDPIVTFDFGPAIIERSTDTDKGFERRAIAFAEAQNAHFSKVLADMFQAK